MNHNPAFNLDFGFEIELLAPRTTATMVERAKDHGFLARHGSWSGGNEWNFGWDTSIKEPHDKFGVEIASPVFQPTLHTFQVHKAMFTWLKNQGCKTNKTCGLHIHVSHPTLTIDARSILNQSRQEQTRPHANRLRYTSWREDRYNHYAAVNNRKSNHVEFRWFNSSINVRYLYHAIHLVYFYVERSWNIDPSLSVLVNRVALCSKRSQGPA